MVTCAQKITHTKHYKSENSMHQFWRRKKNLQTATRKTNCKQKEYMNIASIGLEKKTYYVVMVMQAVWKWSLWRSSWCLHEILVVAMFVSEMHIFQYFFIHPWITCDEIMTVMLNKLSISYMLYIEKKIVKVNKKLLNL